MAGSRALPDLTSRLRIDSSDVAKTEAAVKGMDKQMSETANAVNGHLQKVQAQTKATAGHMNLLGHAFAGVRTSTSGMSSAFIGLTGPLLGVGSAAGLLYE